VIVNGPPLAVTVTFAVAVLEPEVLVAVSVYVVVAVGLTLVDPLAEEDVNDPGVMAMLVAPVVVQLSVLLEPEVMLVGFALKELIAGLFDVLTVTVAVAVVEPAALVAVSVYVVVAVGLTLVEPIEDADVKVPGVMLMLDASAVVQLRVLLAPELTLVGFAANDDIVGGICLSAGGSETPPQLINPIQAPKHAAKVRLKAASPERRTAPVQHENLPLVFRGYA
jgi:hypothetical protein